MGSLNIDPVSVLEEAFRLYCSTCTVFEGIDCHTLTLTHCPKHINGKGFSIQEVCTLPHCQWYSAAFIMCFHQVEMHYICSISN